MRIVLSRKGTDSAAGRCASPVVDGRCVSLPIPAPKRYPSDVTYADLALPGGIEVLSGGKLRPGDACHPDPAFANGRAALGQVDAAQSHLAAGGVGAGDAFVFFGLFGTGPSRAHRIFAYLRVEEVRPYPGRPDPEALVGDAPHPHTRGDLCEWPASNVVYLGTGAGGAPAAAALRLTAEGGPATRWCVPPWMARLGLTYHRNPERWSVPGELRAAPRGQEFVSDVGDDPEALTWLDDTIAAIEGDARPPRPHDPGYPPDTCRPCAPDGPLQIRTRTPIGDPAWIPSARSRASPPRST